VLALVFPGQGAQTEGMGRGLFEPGAPAHALAQEASDLTGLDLPRLAVEAPEDEIRRTEIAQPLLLLHSVALLQALPSPLRAAVGGVAGHSLGEYTALVASGALPWQEAIRLVRARGLAMAAASGPAAQGMSAVLGAEETAVREVLERVAEDGEIAVVANLNAPGQVVISGDLAVLERSAEPLRAAGARRVMALAVGGAFHSPRMAAAAEDLAAAIDAAPIADGLPQAFNLDGRLRTMAAEIRAALKAQLTSTVRWTDCVASLLATGADRFLELGPGTTLTAMGKRIAPEVEWSAVQSPDAIAALVTA
jgi:[acyl-carrier-protein] S-malonyltransferase